MGDDLQAAGDEGDAWDDRGCVSARRFAGADCDGGGLARGKEAAGAQDVASAGEDSAPGSSAGSLPESERPKEDES